MVAMVFHLSGRLVAIVQGVARMLVVVAVEFLVVGQLLPGCYQPLWDIRSYYNTTKGHIKKLADFSDA